MNNVRRKTLNEIRDKIEELRGDLEAVMNEEEDYRDNMPENLQNSERYEKADDACNAMSEAIDMLDDVASNIEDIVTA